MVQIIAHLVKASIEKALLLDVYFDGRCFPTTTSQRRCSMKNSLGLSRWARCMYPRIRSNHSPAIRELTETPIMDRRTYTVEWTGTDGPTRVEIDLYLCGTSCTEVSKLNHNES